MFDKYGEDDYVSDTTNFYNNSKKNQNLTGSDIDNDLIEWDLERQSREQEMKGSGWNVAKITSMTIFFYKSTELIRKNYVKTQLWSNSSLNIENDDKYCFFWSTIAHCIVIIIFIRIEWQIVDHILMNWNNNGFDFNNRFKYSDVHMFWEIE